MMENGVGFFNEVYCNDSDAVTNDYANTLQSLKVQVINSSSTNFTLNNSYEDKTKV